MISVKGIYLLTDVTVLTYFTKASATRFLLMSLLYFQFVNVIQETAIPETLSISQGLQVISNDL